MTSRATFSSFIRVPLWLFLFGALVVACAVSVPPSGGPEDRTPAAVRSTVPSQESTGVDPASSVSITFSEPVARDGFLRFVEFSPPIEIRRISWSGHTATITPVDSLHPDTTYVVSIKSGFRDSHNVPDEKGFSFAFATGAQLDTGSVSGTVYFRRVPSKKAVVNAFVLPRDSGFAPETAPSDRQSKVTATGAYDLRYLGARGRGVLVWAFEDANANGTFDAETEHGAVYPDTIVLSASSPTASARDIFIVDPTEPATVKGRVINETGIDSVFVLVGLFARGDTLPPAYLGACDRQGNYEFQRVAAGVYGLIAFMDFQADSVCATYPCGADSADTCREPCVAADDSLRVAPGGELQMPELRLVSDQRRDK